METISTDSPSIATPVSSREIQGASEISSRQPLSEAARNAIVRAHVKPEYIDSLVGVYRQKITAKANGVEKALQVARPTTSESLPVNPAGKAPLVEKDQERPVFTDEELELKEQEQIAESAGSEQYEGVFIHAESANPSTTMKRNSEVVRAFLQSLGSTNALRTNRGFDATFELARMQHLLRTSYEAVPEQERTSDMLQAEAQVLLEQALLWRPESYDYSIGRAGNVPQEHRSLIANPEDPNVFTEEQLQQLTPRERWTLIGRKLADDAAQVFEDIVTQMENEISDGKIPATEARLAELLEAATHGADMRIRSLQIELYDETDPEKVQILLQEIATIHNKQSTQAQNLYMAIRPSSGVAWPESTSRALASIYECLVLSHKRAEAFKEGRTRQFIRLATLREDKTSHMSPTPRDPETGKILQTKIKVSMDVLVEDISGVALERIQVKHKTQEGYDEYNKVEVDGEMQKLQDYLNASMVFEDDAYKGTTATV